MPFKFNEIEIKVSRADSKLGAVVEVSASLDTEAGLRKYTAGEIYQAGQELHETVNDLINLSDINEVSNGSD